MMMPANPGTGDGLLGTYIRIAINRPAHDGRAVISVRRLYQLRPRAAIRRYLIAIACGKL